MFFFAKLRIIYLFKKNYLKKNIIQGAICAARENCDVISLNHFENAIDRIIGGLEKKSLKLSESDLTTVAYHEAGHAIVGHFSKNCDQLIKISLVPRGKGLGYTQFKLSDNLLISREKIFDQICVLLGGRAAEEYKFNSISSGAADDLKKATDLAYKYINLQYEN